MNVSKISGFINNSKTTQRVLSGVSKNPAVASTMASVAAAGIMRPALISLMPMKDKEDKKYSIASSIAAGLTELLAAPLIYVPFNKMLSKSGELLSKSTGNIFSNNPAMVKGYQSVTNRLFKMAVVPFVSLFRFATVSPVVKTLFGKEGEKK